MSVDDVSRWKPLGWEEMGDEHPIESLSDIERWLKDRIHYRYPLGLPAPAFGPDPPPTQRTARLIYTNRTKRNLYRLFDHLGIHSFPPQPPDFTDEEAAQARLIELQSWVRGRLAEAQAALHAAMLKEINTGHASEPSRPAKPKRRGRKANYKREQYEQRIADDWKRAKGRVPMVDFAREIGMRPKEFERLVERVALRKKRSSLPDK